MSAPAPGQGRFTRAARNVLTTLAAIKALPPTQVPVATTVAQIPVAAQPTTYPVIPTINVDTDVPSADLLAARIKGTGLRRSASELVSMPSSDCIGNFIRYLVGKAQLFTDIPAIKAKLENTNVTNVVSNLILLMNYKGFPKLDITLAMDLYHSMFAVELDRLTTLNKIASWNGAPNPIQPGTDTRKLLTFKGNQLEKATVHSTPEDYFPSYSQSPNTEITVNETEKERINAIWINITNGQTGEKNSKITKSQTLTKKVCGTCWICGTDIHAYAVNGIEIMSCGQDEHVLPPIAGNIHGLLTDNINSTIRQLQKSHGARLGLRPSHSWCNQVKNDLIFLQPPTSLHGYQILDKGVDDFVEKGTEWLSTGTRKNTQPLHSFEPEFSFKQKSKEVQIKLAAMRANICSYIQHLCDVLNSCIIPPTVVHGSPAHGLYSPYTMFMLRMIFNGCLIGHEILFPSHPEWNKRGGGVNEEIDKYLNNIYNSNNACDNIATFDIPNKLPSENPDMGPMPNTPYQYMDEHDLNKIAANITNSRPDQEITYLVAEAPAPVAAASAPVAAAAAGEFPEVEVELEDDSEYVRERIREEEARLSKLAEEQKSRGKYISPPSYSQAPQEENFSAPPSYSQESQGYSQAASQEEYDEPRNFQREQQANRESYEAKAKAKEAKRLKNEAADEAKRLANEARHAMKEEVKQAKNEEYQAAVKRAETLRKLYEQAKRSAEAAAERAAAFRSFGGKKTKNKKQRKTKKNNKMKRTTKSKKRRN